MKTFAVLVDYLQQCRKAGITRLNWSQVAVELKKRSPEALPQAGVSRIKEYLLLAREAKIVLLWGVDSTDNQWVELNPNLISTPIASKSTDIKDMSSKPLTFLDPTFAPLVRTLTSMSKNGQTYRFLRSALGEQLLREFPYVYQMPGTRSLGEYLSKAEQAGIVSLGSGSLPGREWVELTITRLMSTVSL